MYGRCETDPFDQATDVCDSCYGEFCSACMVKTKGRKHPICKECAIIASGVRQGAKPLLRGSKKTAAERRVALQEAPESPRTFEYFDDDLQPTTVEPEPALEPAAIEEDRSSWPADDERGPTGPTVDEPPLRRPEAEDPPTRLEAEDPPTRLEAERPPTGSEPEDAPTGPAVTPGLAALAKHQADRRVAVAAPESVPAPDWLTGSIDDDIEPTQPDRGQDETVPWPSDEPRVEPTKPTRRLGADDKPVTDGFEWVTQMPARGSTTPLPSRSGSGRGR